MHMFVCVLLVFKLSRCGLYWIFSFISVKLQLYVFLKWLMVVIMMVVVWSVVRARFHAVARGQRRVAGRAVARHVWVIVIAAAAGRRVRRRLVVGVVHVLRLPTTTLTSRDVVRRHWPVCRRRPSLADFCVWLSKSLLLCRTFYWCLMSTWKLSLTVVFGAALWTSAVVKLQRLTDCAVNVMADGRYSVAVFEMPLYLINHSNCIFSHRPSSRWYCICVFSIENVRFWNC